MNLIEELTRLVRDVERVAFDIPAPNAYTPRILNICARLVAILTHHTTRDPAERIQELLLANNALVERVREAERKYAEAQEEVTALHQIVISHDSEDA